MRFLVAALTICAALPARATDARDPWLQPFASTSIWNMPLGSAAVFVPAQLAPAAHIGLDGERFWRVATNAPERPVFAPKSWSQRAGGTQQLGTLQLDDDIVVPDARPNHTPNECAAFLMPDGHTVRQVAPLCRPVAGGPVFGYLFHPDNNLHGAGISGGHGGSGMSALGGSLRLGELTGAEPIRHALKVDIWCQRFAYFGAARPGFRWPARCADSYAAQKYGGTNQAVVMGTLLALPPSVQEAALALQTPVGRKLFRALQDYGAYVVDDAAWDCHYLCAEHGVGAEIEKAYGLKFDDTCAALLHDINALFTQLCVVDNNAPDCIGGGGKPRVSLAPPLAAQPAGAPHAQQSAVAPKVVIRNPSMTEGQDKPVGWTDQWIASGKIAVTRDVATFHSAPAALAVASVGGPAHAQAMQFVSGAPGQRLALRAWLRTEGKANAIFGVQSYTADWKGIEFTALGNALPGCDWQQVSGAVTLPPKTARFAVLLLLQGEGKAWLDDVEVGAESGPAMPPAPKVAPPPQAANAWSPAEGFWKDFPQAWRQTAQDQIERAKKGGVNLVFIGDSLTQGWDKQLWQERYAPLGAVNFGIGGDGTPQVLWRIAHGILDGLQPKVIVLMVGINNTWPGYTAADSVKGIRTIVAAIQQKQPQAKILLLGVLPIFDKHDGVRKTICDINAAIATLDDGQRVRFLDMGAKFLENDGARRADLYKPDRLHLTPAAYQIWADSMGPLLKEMLR